MVLFTVSLLFSLVCILKIGPAAATSRSSSPPHAAAATITGEGEEKVGPDVLMQQQLRDFQADSVSCGKVHSSYIHVWFMDIESNMSDEGREKGERERERKKKWSSSRRWRGKKLQKVEDDTFCLHPWRRASLPAAATTSLLLCNSSGWLWHLLRLFSPFFSLHLLLHSEKGDTFAPFPF